MKRAVLGFFFSILLVSLSFAGNSYPRGFKKCLIALSAVPKKDLLDHVDQAVTLHGLKDHEEARLLLLDNLLSNPDFIEILSKNDHSVAAIKLKNLINQGSSQEYYKKVIQIIECRSPPRALTYILLARQSLVPAYMPAPHHLPPDAFKDKAHLSKRLSEALSVLFEGDATLRPVHFTRRLFAYMGRAEGLSQIEKYNLTNNFIVEFRRQINEHNALIEVARLNGFKRERLAQYSYNPLSEIAEDGTFIICGTEKCSYYFAITSDSDNARFYIVHRGQSSTPFDINTWSQHTRIREALPN